MENTWQWTPKILPGAFLTLWKMLRSISSSRRWTLSLLKWRLFKALLLLLKCYNKKVISSRTHYQLMQTQEFYKAIAFFWCSEQGNNEVNRISSARSCDLAWSSFVPAAKAADNHCTGQGFLLRHESGKQRHLRTSLALIRGQQAGRAPEVLNGVEKTFWSTNGGILGWKSGMLKANFKAALE